PDFFYLYGDHIYIHRILMVGMVIFLYETEPQQGGYNFVVMSKGVFGVFNHMLLDVVANKAAPTH
ncbi:hypothetical protein ACVGW6_02630, partial [Enterobacter intestinihominis]